MKRNVPLVPCSSPHVPYFCYNLRSMVDNNLLEEIYKIVLLCLRRSYKFRFSSGLHEWQPTIAFQFRLSIASLNFTSAAGTRDCTRETFNLLVEAILNFLPIQLCSAIYIRWRSHHGGLHRHDGETHDEEASERHHRGKSQGCPTRTATYASAWYGRVIYWWTLRVTRG